MKTCISVFLFFLIGSTYGQSPTFQALVALNHNVNNNAFELKKGKESNSELFWANIYFNYYKNPNTRGAQEPDESMIFSVGYEYLIQTNIEEHSEFKFSFPKGSEEDKFTTYRVSVLTNVSKESKLKRKYIDTTNSDSTFELSISKERLPDTGLLRIYCQIESFNFKTLRATLKTDNNVKSYFSFNLTELFKYNMPNLNMTQINKRTNSFNLKHFTYQSTPIVDYNVTSNSFKWELENNHSEVLVLKSISINLPVDLGTSPERIMRYSN